MKRSLNILIKGLLVIVLFTGTSIALSTAGVKTVNEAKAAVSYQQVYNYLVCNGYEVITLNPYKLNDNWYAHTVKNGVHYMTTVFVEGTQIVGLESVPY